MGTLVFWGIVFVFFSFNRGIRSRHSSQIQKNIFKMGLYIGWRFFFFNFNGHFVFCCSRLIHSRIFF